MEDATAHPFDDEVIADSEDENEMGMGSFPILKHITTENVHRSSPVSAFTITNHYQKTVHSSISNFTAGTSAIPDHPSRFTSAEREIRREMNAETPIASVSAYTDFDGIASSIADRAKTRQRPAKTAAPILDVIELTSEDDDFNIDASKSKSKQKSKSKTKTKDAGKVQQIPPGLVVPASDTPAAAPPRPRPRPRIRVLPPHPIVDAPLPPTSTPPSCGPELPIATSPPRVPDYAMPSQLPPSDPPMPTISTIYTDDPRARAPPIAYLNNAPPSSPSSLFSEGASSSKRKRRAPDVDELDELATSQGIPTGGIFMSPPRGMPPPPTYFAGSSSSSIGRPPPVLVPEIVDLTTLPPTIAPPPKSKKKAKKKVDMSIYDESAGNKMLVLDEDDQDDDFDPSGDGSSKKKKKTKVKDKEKPTKSKAKAKAPAPPRDTGDTPGKGQVEVVIDVRPPSRASAKAKLPEQSDKGKQKAPPTNKEVFKSSEFIVDSDDDELALMGPGEASRRVGNVSPHVVSQGEKSALPAATVEKGRIASPQRSLSPLTDLESPKAGPSKRTGGGTKKRKSILDSEAEEDDFMVDTEVPVGVTLSVSSKKRKVEGPSSGATSTKITPKPKKGKNIVLSDDEFDDEITEQPPAVAKPGKPDKPPNPKASRNAIVGQNEDEDATEERAPRPAKPDKPSKLKPSRKVVLDEEEDEDMEDLPGSPKGQRTVPETPALKASKENIPVTARPEFSTPAPSSRQNPAVPPSSGKTPLYARYEIAPRKSSLPMSELIRRANSVPGSPFGTPHPSTPAAPGSSRLKPLTRPGALVYSPLLKSSRSMLSRIASLHPNRRTPPPPPPPPPPRRKTKKELEMEERWEEEMVESVGGMEAWAVLGDEERREIRKAKRAMEMGGWDE